MVLSSDVGGYFGQSTEQRMQEEIMTNGPVTVAFEVYSDFVRTTPQRPPTMGGCALGSGGE